MQVRTRVFAPGQAAAGFAAANGPRRGWTLAEVIVSVGLATLAIALLWRLFGGLNRQEARAMRVEDVRHEAARLLFALKQDLRSCRDFRAGESEIVFRLLKLDASGKPAEAEARYQRRGQDWSRESSEAPRQVFSFGVLNAFGQRLKLDVDRLDAGSAVCRARVLDSKDATVIEVAEKVALGNPADTTPAPPRGPGGTP